MAFLVSRDKGSATFEKFGKNLRNQENIYINFFRVFGGGISIIALTLSELGRILSSDMMFLTY